MGIVYSSVRYGGLYGDCVQQAVKYGGLYGDCV